MNVKINLELYFENQRYYLADVKTLNMYRISFMIILVQYNTFDSCGVGKKKNKLKIGSSDMGVVFILSLCALGVFPFIHSLFLLFFYIVRYFYMQHKLFSSLFFFFFLFLFYLPLEMF